MATTSENSAAVADLVAQIRGNIEVIPPKSNAETIRAKAWQHAYVVGPAAIQPVAALMVETKLEITRAAKRAVWKIVRHAGRPGAEVEREAAVAELLGLLSDDQPRAVRAEVLWMLSEIAGDEAVEPVAALLSNEELREDARMVLQRIDGDASLAALQAAMTTVPDDFKINIAQSLRARGVKVEGRPCQKLLPTKQTNVKPVGR